MNRGEILDALIVGAGPTGLTAALELARRGLRVRVIDKATSPPVDRSRAVAVQARTLEIFGHLGIVEEARRRGIVNPAVNVLLRKGKRVRVPLTGFEHLSTPYPEMLMLPQEQDEALLGAKLAEHGVTIERGVAITGLAQDEAEVRATLGGASAEEIRAHYLIGCDGAHSFVRRALNVPFDGDTYDDHCLLGELRVGWDLPHELYLCPTRRGILAAFPTPGEARYRVVCILPGSHPAERGATDSLSLSLEELTAIAREIVPIPFTMREPKVLSRYRLHHRMAGRFRVGRVLLAGDAAHIHSPAGGQGMNTGIQDAWNLGWKIAAARAGVMPEWVVGSYEDERMPVARKLLAFTDRAFGLLAGHGIAGGAIRTVAPEIAPRLFAVRAMQKRLVAFVSQLGIRYRESPLTTAIGEAPNGAPWAGDRAPDVAMAGGARLFDRIGTSHLLVLVGASAERRASLAAFERNAAIVVADERVDGAFARRYRAEKTAALLIRPDGYIAVRTDPVDVEAMRGELERRLLR